MVFWMRKAARSIKSELHTSIDDALGHRSGQGAALVAMVFFAVAREGLESVFFLLAIFQQSANSEAPLGALLGILVSIGLGYGIYAGGVRLNLKRFFYWTGLFILVVAAGILAGSLRHLHEAGVWNSLQTVVFDLSNVLPVSSAFGTLLSGMFGYQDMPTLGEIIAYVAFLAVSLFFFLRPAQRQGAAAASRPTH